VKKRVFILALVMAFSLVLAACGSATPTSAQEGGTLIVSLMGDPMGLNPDTGMPDDNYVPVAQNIFNKLIKLNAYQEIIPDLAKDWAYSEDGKTLTFNLNEGVTWHDGKPFTSADVKATFDTIVEKKGFAASFLTNVKEIACPDDLTVEFRLSDPDVSLLGNLAWISTDILPAHILKTGVWEDWTKPIGTGPFKFVSWEKGVSITLEKNPDYFAATPHLDKVVFSVITDQNTTAQSFYNGEVDVLGGNPPYSEVERFKTDADIATTETRLSSRFYVTFNTTREPFDDVRVREAVALAINQDDIINKALKGLGEPSKYYISPNYDWALNEEATVPERDVEKAKGLLEAAGYKADANGNYLTLTIDVFNPDPFPDMATVLKDNLRDIGIDAKLNVMEYANWMEQVYTNRDFSLTLLTGYQGPDISAIYSRIASAGDMNITGYKNAELDKLLTDGASCLDEKDRAPYYKDLQKILARDFILVPMSEWIDLSPHRSYVKGHPAEKDISEKAAAYEYAYVWLDK